MISLTHLAVTGPRSLMLTFSDGQCGEWSAQEVVAHNTVLTRPLEDQDYFARAFIEGGDALAWPNGLELSARNLHHRLGEAGKLMRKAA